MIKRMDKEILAKYHQGRQIVRKYHQGRLYYDALRWLNGATKQAILVAFGADGAAVIRATNAYLNGIAATDQSKAQALAALINEDPMIVCSLGLSVEGVTMPIRWLVGDGTATFFTGHKPTDSTVMRGIMKKDATYSSGWEPVFGGRNASQGNNTNSCFYLYTNASQINVITRNGATSYNYRYVNDMEMFEFEVSRSRVYIKTASATLDQAFTSGTIVPAYTEEIEMFCLNQSGSHYGNEKPFIGKMKIVELDGSVFIPFLRNNIVEVLDIGMNVLAERHGTFSIAYTLQDGVTPWTPLTP